MQIRRLSLLLTLIALAGIAWPGGLATLTVTVPPAVALVQPAPEGRRLVRLPALEFEFGIQASCGPDSAVTSVSISVADTRKTLAGTDIPQGAAVTTTFALPARQLAPIAVDDFCPESQDGDSSLLLRDTITAHVSLRCAGDDGDLITYASQPLDVTLVCEAGPEIQGDAPASSDR